VALAHSDDLDELELDEDLEDDGILDEDEEDLQACDEISEMSIKHHNRFSSIDNEIDPYEINGSTNPCRQLNDECMRDLNQVTSKVTSKDITKEISELNSRLDTELTNDLIVCCKCSTDFRLSDIMLFIEHKINKCNKVAGQDAESSQGSLFVYKCQTCAKYFKSAAYLLEHCELAHDIQICKKFTRGGEATAPVTPNCFNMPVVDINPDEYPVEQSVSRSSSATSSTYRNNSFNSSFISPSHPQQRKQYQTKPRLVHQQHQYSAAAVPKKVKTKHDQIYYPTPITPTTQQTQASILSPQQTGNNSFNKFKNIKTINITTTSPSLSSQQTNVANNINPVTGKFINQMGKVKNNQFIAAHLSNQNNGSGPTVKINSSLSNRLRVEEIKMQQQQHMKKQEMLRELASSSVNSQDSEQQQKQHEVGQTEKDLSEEVDQTEGCLTEKKQSDNVECTANLFVSTKSGSSPDPNGISNNLIAIKTENPATTPIAVKLTNGNSNSGKYN